MTRKMHENNASGRTGVSWDSASQQWQVRMTIAGSRINFGLFKKYKDAMAMADSAEQTRQHHKKAVKPKRKPSRKLHPGVTKLPDGTFTAQGRTYTKYSEAHMACLIAEKITPNFMAPSKKVHKPKPSTKEQSHPDITKLPDGTYHASPLVNGVRKTRIRATFDEAAIWCSVAAM